MHGKGKIRFRTGAIYEGALAGGQVFIVFLHILNT